MPYTLFCNPIYDRTSCVRLLFLPTERPQSYCWCRVHRCSGATAAARWRRGGDQRVRDGRSGEESSGATGPSGSLQKNSSRPLIIIIIFIINLYDWRSSLQVGCRPLMPAPPSKSPVTLLLLVHRPMSLFIRVILHKVTWIFVFVRVLEYENPYRGFS